MEIIKVENIHSYVDNSKEQFLDILKELVSHPSVSTNKEDVHECALYIKSLMEKLGITADIIETKGNPVIIANIESKQKNRKTIIFYGHYDVQPPEPIELWNSDPFKPEVRDGRIYGRGVADNKGQFLTHLLAVGAYLNQYDDVPVNIKIVLDGEEEIGSENLTHFVRNNKELLQADLVITSDGPLEVNNIPLVQFGVRGVMNFDIIVETATTDNHSGNKGGVIKNAAWELMRILKTMIDDNDNVLIEGFYDDVNPIIESDLEIINNLEFNKEEIARAYGVKSIDLDKETFYKNLMLKPTLTINGLNSGYLGDGCKNIIPKKAVAKMEVRLVASQEPSDILRKIEKHVKSVNNDAKVIQIEEDMYPSRTSTDNKLGKIIINSIKEYLGSDVVVKPAGGGSLPDYIWTNILNVPSIMVPYGNIDESNHAPNENFMLELFYRGIHLSVQMINDLAYMVTV